MTDEAGRIRIFRSPDADPPFTVLLDGEVVGDLEHGKDRVLDVAPGRHVVELGMGDAGSPTREVTVAAGDDVVLGCRSRAGGVNVVFGLLGRGHYIPWR